MFTQAGAHRMSSQLLAAAAAATATLTGQIRHWVTAIVQIWRITQGLKGSSLIIITVSTQGRDLQDQAQHVTVSG